VSLASRLPLENGRIERQWIISNRVRIGTVHTLQNRQPTFSFINSLPSLFSRSQPPPSKLDAGTKRGSHMAKRQKKSSFVERLKQSFHRFWNERQA
jgi:hypothetical protein